MSSAVPSRAMLGALVAAAIFPALGVRAEAAAPEVSNFDARARGAQTEAPPGAAARRELRERLGRFAALSVDRRTGTLRAIGRLDGFLTRASGRDGASIALEYLRDHARAFGLDADDADSLHLVDRDVVQGVEHLSWEQRHRGIPAADAGLKAAVTGSGKLLTVTGPPASDLAVGSIVPDVSALDAYAAARASGGGDASTLVTVEHRDDGAERATRFSDGGRASLALYRAGDGYRLAWRVLAPVSSTGVYDMLVDARSGATVRRHNHVKFAAPVPADVFPYNPARGGQVAEDFEPWLADPPTDKLEGPNAHAFVDENDAVGPQPDGTYQLTPEDGSDVEPENGGYEFPLGTVATHTDDGCPGTSTTFPSSICTWDPTVPGSWAANRKQSATQLFYFVNTFHDHLRTDPDIAFEESGFRTTDEPLGDPNGDPPADASDPVLAQALDGAAIALEPSDDGNHLNNANFLTLPDGSPGFLQMYLWAPPYGGYDSANDASMVFHEYTHGLSGRLVTDAAGFEALGTPQAGALSEGWSDFYALDFLVEQGLQSDVSGVADVRFGRYLDNASSPLVRTQSIDCEPSSPSPSGACPAAAGAAGAGAFTYADFARIGDDGPQFHDDGEIWGQTLWSLRAALIDAHPPGVGSARARRYITEAMRISPPEPSFLDMRNAIVQVAFSLHGNQDWDTIWDVFAARGMGWSASTDGPNDLTPIAADDSPPAPGTGGRGDVSGTILDEAGAPVAGVTVAVGGHDTVGEDGPWAADIRTASTANGGFALSDVPAGTYADLYFRKAGYQELTTGVVVAADQMTTRTIKPLRRDYASTVTGATASATGPDYSASGCGAAKAVDDDKRTVWSTDADGPKDLIVNLGRQLDLAQVRIDPRAGCGDPPGATLASYELYASDGPGAPWDLIAGGTIGPLDARGYASLGLAGDLSGRRQLRLRAIAPLSTDQGVGPFMDVSELEVTGSPTPPPPPAPTPTPTPTPAPTASPTPTPVPPVTATKLESSRLTASRKGLFKVKLRFGNRAPVGKARLSVLARKKRIAAGTLTVRPGQTSTKTLRLTSTGRRLIRPGRWRKVVLELRLPGGEKVQRTVRLSRKRR